MNGNLPPNCATLAFQGELFQAVAHFVFSLEVYSCLSVDALVGSGFLRIWGRLSMALEHPAAASFSSLSTPLLQWLKKLPQCLLVLERLIYHAMMT